jgi:hypothetical protein
MDEREELKALRRLAELEAKAGSNVETNSAAESSLKGALLNAPLPIVGNLRNAGNMVAGGVRGAGSIGSTIMRVADYTNPLMAPLAASRDAQRRTDMTGALENLGADSNSGAFQVGKLGTEIAGTAGVGNAFGLAARAAGASPAVVNALTTSGMKAGTTPGAMNMFTRALSGAATGAGSAGLADMQNIPAGAVLGGSMPIAAYLGGAAGNKLLQAREFIANRLMQSAIKPTIDQLKSGDAAVAIKTLLDNGINPNKSGVDKLRLMIDDVDDKITSAITNSGATVNKQAVLSRLNDTKATFGNQVSPVSDLAAIDSVGSGFMTHPSFPLPQTAIPVQAAQDMKRGTYQVLAKKYGQMGSADVEAQKALARGLKEEIATAVPGIAQLNAKQSQLLTTLDVAERRALMELNKNPMGLAALTTDPKAWALFMADKSALFKSLAARMVNPSQSAGPVNKLLAMPEAPQMIRNAAVTSYGASRTNQQ